MTWRLPLHGVKALLADHLMDKSKTSQHFGAQHCWQGYAFQACITVASCERIGGGDEYHTSFGLGMRVINLPERATCSAFFKQHMLDTRNGIYGSAGTATFIGAPPCAAPDIQGRLYAVQLGSLSNTVEAEDRLRELGLVHSDGCLVVASMVSHVG
jgi:hypothetical protein